MLFVAELAPLQVDRQVRRLGVYAALTYPFACIPFLYFYLRDYGIGIDAYAHLIAIYYATMVIAEVPTGLLADRFGRRLALIAGPSVLAVGFLTMRLGSDFATFACGEILLGLGHSLLSGPPSALLFDSLALAGRAEGYLRTEATLHAWRALGTGLSFLLGGIVATLAGIAPTITLTAGLCAAGAVVALTLREPARKRAHTPVILSTALRELRQRDTRWIAIYYVVVFCLLRYCFHTYQPYLQEAEQENPLVLGVLFCALNVVAAPWSRAVPSLVRSIGERALLWAMPLAMALSLIAMAGAVGTLGIALFFVHQAPFGAHWAVVQAYANRRLTSQARATALSVLSFAGRIAFAALFPLLGWLHAEAGLRTTYVATGVAFVLVTWLVMGRQPR